MQYPRVRVNPAPLVFGWFPHRHSENFALDTKICRHSAAVEPQARGVKGIHLLYNFLHLNFLCFIRSVHNDRRSLKPVFTQC